MELKELIQQKLKDNFSEASLEFSEFRDELSVKLNKKYILQVCKFLKEDSDLEFVLCEDITAVDWATRKNRFTVVYHIFSIKNNFRLVLKSDVDESENDIDSVSSVWKTSDWQERECYLSLIHIFST